jgi:hypothetical protein
VLAGLAFLLVRAIRRYRDLAGARETRSGSATPEPMTFRRAMARGRPASRVWLRRELPDDKVRRWYAEALLALEAKGLPRPTAGTPSEYLSAVARSFPESAPGFTALTRGYEDVRYGSRRIGREELDRLEAHRRMAMDALRRAASIEEAT